MHVVLLFYHTRFIASYSNVLHLIVDLVVLWCSGMEFSIALVVLRTCAGILCHPVLFYCNNGV